MKSTGKQTAQYIQHSNANRNDELSVTIFLLRDRPASKIHFGLLIPPWLVMDTALVLRAATCWDAWHDALARLKAKGLGKQEATKFLEDADWQLTRVPAED